ncbi:hypothetical protein ANO14919_066050 [Xylariales sp. No.14919]|nr:hypothetical protein ANO14919_066050 [Xylariales sp. No.14919]
MKAAKSRLFYAEQARARSEWTRQQAAEEIKRRIRGQGFGEASTGQSGHGGQDSQHRMSPLRVRMVQALEALLDRFGFPEKGGSHQCRDSVLPDGRAADNEGSRRVKNPTW